MTFYGDFSFVKKVCPVHGEYNAVVLSNGHIGGCSQCFKLDLMCSVNNEVVKIISSCNTVDNEKDKTKALIAAGVPSLYLSKPLESYVITDPQSVQKNIYEKVSFFAKTFPHGKSLGLIGNTGSGKTHLACGVIHEVVGKGHSALFAPIMGLLRSVKATYHKSSDATEGEVLERYISPDFLVLDDMGVKIESDFDRSIFYEIINSRYLEEKSTMLTSNMTIPELLSSLGERSLGRLQENGEFYACKWTSYRSLAKKDAAHV